MTPAVRYALTLGIVLGRLAQGWSQLPFFYDDSFVSLRYAQRLLAGEGLTWTDGERVEGYSDLLWVLACAGLGAIGIDLVDAARALGLASALAIGGAVVRARAVPEAGLVALALVAASSPRSPRRGQGWGGGAAHTGALDLVRAPDERAHRPRLRLGSRDHPRVAVRRRPPWPSRRPRRRALERSRRRASERASEPGLARIGSCAASAPP